VGLDMANVYGQNLRTFLQQLPYRMILTNLNPLTGRRYKEVFLQDNKTDAIDAAAAARFAIVEKPPASPDLDPFHQQLLALVSRYESQTRTTTALINQLHQALSRAWPEFVGLFADLSAATARAVLRKAPTANKAAAARAATLARVRPCPRSRCVGIERARQLIDAGRASTASLSGPDAELIVQDVVAQLDLSIQIRDRLRKRIEALFAERPPNPLMTITGVGPFTAAVLTAKIGHIGRFASADKLVGYFGIYAVIHDSGTRKGQLGMSRKGSDLARKALFMACQSGVQHNPALRKLYRRKLAQGKPKMVALGHCMRKLLHLVYAVWSKDEPFDPQRHVGPSLVAPQKTERREPQSAADAAIGERSSQRSDANEHNTKPSSRQAISTPSLRPGHQPISPQPARDARPPSRGDGRTKKVRQTH